MKRTPASPAPILALAAVTEQPPRLPAGPNTAAPKPATVRMYCPASTPPTQQPPGQHGSTAISKDPTQHPPVELGERSRPHFTRPELDSPKFLPPNRCERSLDQSSRIRCDSSTNHLLNRSPSVTQALSEQLLLCGTSAAPQWRLLTDRSLVSLAVSDAAVHTAREVHRRASPRRPGGHRNCSARRGRVARPGCKSLARGHSVRELRCLRQ